MEELQELRDEAKHRESESDKIVKDTIATLKKWDKKTEELVSQLQVARDKHVSKSAWYFGKGGALELFIVMEILLFLMNMLSMNILLILLQTMGNLLVTGSSASFSHKPVIGLLGNKIDNFLLFAEFLNKNFI